MATIRSAHNRSEEESLLQVIEGNNRESKMAPAKSNLSTQRTFDSSDDLLENEEVLDDIEDDRAPTTHENVTKVTSVWDCRAVNWPPHSIKTVVKSGFDYLRSPFLILEMFVLGLFILACYKLPAHLLEGHVRPIPLQTISTGESLIDLIYANEYEHHETIPGSLLTILCFIVPCAVFGVFGIFFGPQGDAHAAICAYILTMATKIFVTAMMKRYAGYLRPNFYEMCEFNTETLVCDNEFTSARESFPSGHAGTGMSSMTLLALYLLGKVRGGIKQRGVKAERRGDPHDELWTPSLLSKVLSVVAVSPVLLGMFIAVSRVRDNWHHPADVVCGGLIGIACAYFAHSLWYPSVYSHYGGIPLATVEKIVTERRKAHAPPRVSVEVGLGMDSDIES